MSEPTEHVIIVRADLTEPTALVKVDVGTLAPFVAAGLLYQASMALDLQPGPIVSVIYDDEVIAEIDPNSEEAIADDE